MAKTYFIIYFGGLLVNEIGPPCIYQNEILV